MALKFCPNCGNKLDGSPKFCQNCGYDLNGNQSNINESPSYDTQSSRPTINVNVPVPNAIAGSGGLKRDYKEGHITEYKNAMGLTTGVSNIVVAEVANGGKTMLFGALAELAAHWYILSFEDEGIVMIGMTKMSHYSGKNVFLPADKIDSVSIRKGIGKKVITIVHSGEKAKFYVNTMLAGCPYQHENYKNIDALLNKYTK